MDIWISNVWIMTFNFGNSQMKLFLLRWCTDHVFNKTAGTKRPQQISYFRHWIFEYSNVPCLISCWLHTYVWRNYWTDICTIVWEWVGMGYSGVCVMSSSFRHNIYSRGSTKQRSYLRLVLRWANIHHWNHPPVQYTCTVLKNEWQLLCEVYIPVTHFLVEKLFVWNIVYIENIVNIL